MNTCATEGRRELFDLSDQLDPDVARYVLERDRLYALQNSPSEVSKLPDEEYTQQESLRALTEIILRKYTPLVGNMAKRFGRKGRKKEIGISDLKQEGLLGIVRALELYNPEKGSFVNYAKIWINSNLNRYQKNNALTINEPVEIQQIKFRIGKATRGDEEIDPKKISKQTGLSEEKIRWVLEVPEFHFIDIDSISSKGRSFEEVIADHQPSTEDIAAQRELQEIIADYLSALPERERKIMLGQYYEGKNNIEIGREMALSEARIRELQKTVLQKLKKRLPKELSEDRD